VALNALIGENPFKNIHLEHFCQNL